MENSNDGPLALEIEHNVPVPTRSMLSGYDWSKWKVGDSALVPQSKRQTVLKAGKAYLDENNIDDRDFITRTVDGGSRIWLVEATKTDS